MPVNRCQSGGKPGYKWGDAGKCYTYTPGDSSSEEAAKDKARRQGQAIIAGGGEKAAGCKDKRKKTKKLFIVNEG